jgi:hypothetical protein
MHVNLVQLAGALLPDVVWIFLAYIVGLDLLKFATKLRTAPGSLMARLGAAFNPTFLIGMVAEDVTAQHAVSLAVTGFVAGMYAGQSLKMAALGAIVGAATASVADEKETFGKALKAFLGIA